MGLVEPDGTWEHHGGKLRFMDCSGSIIADQIDAQNYREVIGEAVQKSSYLKSPYYKPMGFPVGMYRVGPLARLNLCERMGSPKADAELKHFRSFGRGTVTSSFLYHYARLIEIVAGLERVEFCLDDPELSSTDLRADAGINRLRGVGVSESLRAAHSSTTTPWTATACLVGQTFLSASDRDFQSRVVPRSAKAGDWKVATTGIDGVIRKVNLLVATGQNNLARNRTVA